MSPSESLIGTIIGNYEILSELGRGGMGVVYKAHEQSLQRVVALKILSAHLSEDAALVKRFLREARAGARLNHANIVTTHAVGEHDGTYFIAMEYIKGSPLSKVIRDKGQLDVRRALEWTRQAADALAEAHRNDIIHRDIKPQNIMIDQAGRVKVMDFGLAKLLQASTALTADGVLLGTPLYMSPEQAEGKKVDARTDLYSLGVVLYEMLGGTQPFPGDSPIAVLRQIIDKPLPDLRELNSDVSASVASLVGRMTAKDPNDRPQTAEALKQDLTKELRGEQDTVIAKRIQQAPEATAGAPDVKPAATTKAVPSSWKAIAIGAGLAFALMVAAFGVYRLTVDNPPDDLARSTVEELSLGEERQAPVAGRERDMANDADTSTAVEQIPDRQPAEVSQPSGSEPSSTGTAAGRNVPSDRFTAPVLLPSGSKIDGETITLPGGVELEMISIPAGTFLMGSTNGARHETPVHSVTISSGFQLGRTEVTKAQWEAVMGTTPWSGQSQVSDDPNSPAVYVSWNDVQTYITKVNKLTGKTFRLPTEAEWEYACRAGSTTEYYFSDNSSSLSDYAWYWENAREVGDEYAHVVGQLLPNAFGLYDMHGNVWEWCEDWYGSSFYSSSPSSDPAGPISGSFRVNRGGSWADAASSCRSAFRSWFIPTFTFINIGFRLAR